MKCEVNLKEFLQVLKSASDGQVLAAERARRAELMEGMTFDDRMSLRAVQADEDLQELLTYEIGEDGQPKSKLTTKERLKTQMFYLAMHPDARRRNMAPGAVTVTIDLKGIQQAEKAEIETLKLLEKPVPVIETSAEQVP